MAHSLDSYRALIADLSSNGFRFYRIRTYFDGEVQAPFAFLRHDVDRIPSRAVAMAEVEATFGIASTYYFRCDSKRRFPLRAIRQVQSLGHEIGFHYETLSRVSGGQDAALGLFQKELAALRAITPVVTIAPHGAPLSLSSNMDFGKIIGHEQFGLIGDANTIDFSSILYITDTGGTFGSSHNLRDRPQGRMLSGTVPPWGLAEYLRKQGETGFVLSCHPERWPPGLLGLAQARIQDGFVNLLKGLFARARDLGQP